MALQKQQRKEKIEHFVRYGIAGAMATLTHAVCFFYLRHLEAGVVTANLTAFFIANIVSYVLMSLYVFRVSLLTMKNYVKFLMTTGSGALLVAILSHVSVTLGAADWVALLMVMVCVPVLNYILMRMFVFK